MGSKSALLIANGEIFSKKFLKTLCEDCDCLIAIDGGSKHLFAIKKVPDFVIGDMDSEVHSNYDYKSLKEIIISSQSESDLVKALKWCDTQNFSSITLIGVENGRSDHILGTYAAIVEANIDIKLKIHLYDFVIHILGQGDSVSLVVPEKKIISAFALEKCTGLSIVGTKWNVEDMELDFSTAGLHNESIGGKIDARILTGRLALFIQR